MAQQGVDYLFIGPGADVMARMGDKAQAKVEMRAAGVPLVPGTEKGATLARIHDVYGDLVETITAPRDGYFVRSTTFAAVASGERVATLGID